MWVATRGPEEPEAGIQLGSVERADLTDWTLVTMLHRLIFYVYKINEFKIYNNCKIKLVS